MQSPCGNKVSTQNFVSGSLLSIRVSPSMTARVVFFQALCSFRDFRTQALVRGFVCWRNKVPPGCCSRHTRRIRRCYAGIFCMMIISFRSAYGSSFYNYKAKEKDPHRIGTDQKSEMRISKEFRCCRRTDRSCRDRARGSLHRPGSSGLPASGMFLRSLDRVFRDTTDSLADPSGA